MPQFYTEVFVLKISKTQKQTLEKLKQRNIKVSQFVRNAIKEKIEREAQELVPKKEVEFNPFY